MNTQIFWFLELKALLFFLMGLKQSAQQTILQPQVKCAHILHAVLAKIIYLLAMFMLLLSYILSIFTLQ